MTDTVDSGNNQEAQTQVAEPNAIELEARASGWVPKDEYSGDENKWVDADEFVRRGPLFEKINHTTRELKEVRKALDALKVHHAQVKESAVKEALAKLKAEKRDAYVEGDPDKIVEIDDKIEATKEQLRQAQAASAAEAAQSVQQEIHPVFSAWVSRNQWYEQSKPMKAFADEIGRDLAAKGMSPEKVLAEVEKQVKEEFPNKFRNANRDKAHGVEGAGKGTGKAASAESTSNLTPEEIKVMNTFVRAGIMTKEQYIADLKKVKEL